MSNKPSLKVKIILITGDEIVYETKSSDIKYARTEIVPDKYLEVDGVWYNTNHIVAFSFIKE